MNADAATGMLSKADPILPPAFAPEAVKNLSGKPLMMSIDFAGYGLYRLRKNSVLG